MNVNGPHLANRLWCLCCYLLLLIGLTLSGAGRASRASDAALCPGDYAPGIVLLGFHTATSSVERSAMLSRWTIARDLPTVGITAIHVPVGQECAIAATLRQDPRIASAELDYAIHTADALTPNDPDWSQQWGPAKIRAPQAWAVTTGSPNIVVAVIDTGVRRSHEDLSANIWHNTDEVPQNGLDDDGNGKIDDVWGWHFYHARVWNGEEYTYIPAEDGQVTDENGHGTHVAGIVGAGIDNGVGIAGMAGGTQLMIVKALNAYGDGWYSDIAQAIVYAVDNGARVINISAGGTPSSTVLQTAVDYAYARGVLVVAATGNDGDAVLYPAACEHVLAVAATDTEDRRAGFSNHGPQVDVAAPGVDIYSTWYRGNYFTKSGTSMAAPHVSGLAALVWSVRPYFTPLQVGYIITSTALDVNSGTLQLPGWDEYLGWGRIDASCALSETLRFPGRYYLPLVVRSTSILRVRRSGR